MIIQYLKGQLIMLGQNGVAYSLVCALSVWIGKVWAGRISRKENAKLQEQITILKDDLEQSQKKLAGNIAKSVHIHKVQFEKEFLIYQDLMKHAHELKDSFFILHHTIQPYLENEEEVEQHYNPLREKFVYAYMKARDTIDINKPFYAEKVFVQCDRLINLAIEDMTDLKFSKGSGGHSWDKIEEIKKTLTEIYKDLCNAIRHRLSTIVVVD